MIEIKNILKKNLRLRDLELLSNEVDLAEDFQPRNGKFEEVRDEIDANSEDIEFSVRRGFPSGHFQYSPPSYHYEQHAYQPPPQTYKAVYEVNLLYYRELTEIISERFIDSLISGHCRLTGLLSSSPCYQSVSSSALSSASLSPAASPPPV